VSVAIAAVIALSLASSCGRHCEPPPTPRSVECEPNGDGLPQAVVATWFVDRYSNPSFSNDFGCHFDTDGNMAFFTVDGVFCDDGNARQVLRYDYTVFSARCRPPNGVWFMASGARTVKITATDEGLRCE
jgi:hypothetical protein